ncbi:MAG TPA: DUF2914 domain-containing protein [Geobacteraceae bacterium]
MVRTPLAVMAMLVFLCCAAASATAADLQITEMAVTTKIVKGNPIDAVRRISSTSVKALYCFTRIVNPAGEDTTIKHIWYRNDEQVSEQELKVQGEKWRTWSKRPISREAAGEWRVDALDGAGNLLKTVKFRIN